MNAAAPPAFCACAITCSASVVLPEDSGPKISTTRPRGNPPTPRAASSEMEPLEITVTGSTLRDPSRSTRAFPELLVHLAEGGINGALARGGVNWQSLIFHARLVRVAARLSQCACGPGFLPIQRSEPHTFGGN